MDGYTTFHRVFGSRTVGLWIAGELDLRADLDKVGHGWILRMEVAGQRHQGFAVAWAFSEADLRVSSYEALLEARTILWRDIRDCKDTPRGVRVLMDDIGLPPIDATLLREAMQHVWDDMLNEAFKSLTKLLCSKST